MTNWEDLLDRAADDVHFVQLYTNDQALAKNVGRYFAEGLLQGECGIVINTPAHEHAFRKEIEARGVNIRLAEESAKLVFLNADQTLSRFMVNGRPEWDRFEKYITSTVGSLKRSSGSRVRAYGEMVGILWASGEYSAAIKLEDFWNRILGSLRAPLFCSYPIDVFGPEFEHSGVHAILCDHTHLLPVDAEPFLEESIGKAMDEVLGDCAEEIRSRIDTNGRPEWGYVPRAEGMVLWIRKNIPQLAGEIIHRARQHHRAQS